MAAKVFQEAGRSVRSLARDLRCDESTLRYRLRRLRAGTPDGRRRQPEACAPWDGEIRAWMQEQEEADRPAPVEELYEELVMQGFTGSAHAVRRYVRRRRPVAKRRPRRRVEVRPGSQGQVDWIERRVRLESHGGEPVKVYGFLMVLGFSRMWHLVWSPSQDFAAWIGCHNAALERLGGVPWTLRPDNLKTAVQSGAGPTAVLHAGYASWAGQVGTTINPARVRTPTDKGKVERRARDVESCVDLGRVYVDLAHLQVATEEGIVRRARALVHPLLGGDLLAAWRFEQPHLRALPAALPRPFDVEVCRRADGEGLVSFEGRQYHVPLAALDREVLVRGCGDEVELVVGGETVAVYPRHTRCRRLVRQSFYDGPGTDTVAPAVPLGEVGRWIALETSWQYEAAARGIDSYAALLGGAR